MSWQQFYRESYRRLRPGWRDSVALHRESIVRTISPRMRILDLGCGSATAVTPDEASLPGVYGLDLDCQALRRNQAVRHRVVGSGGQLPFADASFDAIVLTW